MKNITIPAFGESTCAENRENKSSRVWMISDAKAESFTAYWDLLVEAGYTQKEFFRRDTHWYASFVDGECAYFMNYYPALKELMIVCDEKSIYHSYEDVAGKSIVEPQITQVELFIYGCSYVIRLSDGRFIVIDGGYSYEEEPEKLLECLESGSPFEKPVIASWIITHPHSDHYHAVLGFLQRFSDRVDIQRFMLNFPASDDAEHYPALIPAPDTEDAVPRNGKMDLLHELIEKNGAPCYTLHSGQQYQIGDARCEILACMDDTIHRSKNVNTTSVVVRMELGGQVILWASDASFGSAKLAQRHGTYLKSDILQIPHHGFQSGSAEAEIAGYELIRPEVCFYPNNEFYGFTASCLFRRGTKHIMTMPCVKEFITGAQQRTITLPYKAPEYKRRELDEKVRMGERASGARTWIFSDLNSSCPEDFEFTILNMTYIDAQIWVELFFEGRPQVIRWIRANVPALSLRHVNVTSDDVEHDTVVHNHMTVKERGIPENAPFAVRFTSELPFVVTSKRATGLHFN